MRKKFLWLVGGVLCLTLFLFSLRGRAVETGAWGLNFDGERPRGPASEAQLRKLDGAYLGDGQEKVLYLTFDAGYENGHMEKILDTLKAHKAPGAFFLVGNYLEKNHDLVRRMVSEGHIVGNHTMHHRDMSKLRDEAVFRRELEGVEQLFREVTGKELPKFYRPPQGIYSEENLKMAQALGYKTVFWSLAHADWDEKHQPSPEAALKKLLSRTCPGTVVLLHPTSKTNTAILDRLLTEWEKQGYRFESIDKLF